MIEAAHRPLFQKGKTLLFERTNFIRLGDHFVIKIIQPFLLNHFKTGQI